jgi:hypothetical protein
MKRFRMITVGLLSLMLFAIVGSFASTIDPHVFFDAPLLYLIDHVSAGDLAFATFPYGAVLWPAGESNMGGTLNRAYFIPLDGFASFPALPENPATEAEYHTLTGSITLAANCNVIELYTTYKTGTLKSEVEGDIDGKFFKLSPEFFHPGSKAAIINFASYCINTPGILFIPVSSSEYLVVGSPGHPVYLSPAFDLAKVGEGRKGTLFTGEAYSQLMLTKYAGDLPLTPSSS